MKKEPPNGPVLKNALRAALPRTLPVLTGYLFLGMTYGVYMNVSGFPFWYPMLMSIVVFAGSAEFVAVSLLLGPFAPLQSFLVILMLNARHLFYGISMLDKYKGLGLTLACLIVFGPDRFLVPAMGAILLSLTLLRRPLERRAGDAV